MRLEALRGYRSSNWTCLPLLRRGELLLHLAAGWERDLRKKGERRLSAGMIKGRRRETYDKVEEVDESEGKEGSHEEPLD